MNSTYICSALNLSVINSNKFDTNQASLSLTIYVHNLFYRYFIDAPSVNGEMVARTRSQNGGEYDIANVYTFKCIY